MDDNLVGLKLTEEYTGIVITTGTVGEGVYDEIKKVKPPPLRTWYFDAEDKGALWIASGGRHPEPIIAWLERSQRLCGGTSMLVAVLDNRGQIPLGTTIHQFRVGRKPLDAREMHALRESGYYVAYLPHGDEFLILVEHIGQYLSLNRSLNQRGSRWTMMELQDIPSGLPEQRSHSGRAYDPIHSQIKEVLGSVTTEAWRAAGELVAKWREARLDVPDDVLSLQKEVEIEHQEISQEVQVASGQTARSDVLRRVDRYAQRLRARRRSMADLSAKLGDYQLNAPRPPSYERIATPLMLRALERYTNDVAGRLRLVGRVLVPVIGDDYVTNPQPFPPLRPTAWHGSPRAAAIIAIPADFRLRLGAMPMLAREVAALKSVEIKSIADRLTDLRDEDPAAKAILPSLPETDGSADAWTRYKKRVRDTADAIAADLIATAVVGPQYIFALARFAVGTLGESASFTGLPVDGARVEIRLRLQVCLAYLTAIQKPVRFVSLYLPEGAVALPGALVDIVKDVTKEVVLPDEVMVEKATAQLCEGRIVRAEPTTVLAALWGAVATRGCYVNEIAALVSVSAFD